MLPPTAVMSSYLSTIRAIRLFFCGLLLCVVTACTGPDDRPVETPIPELAQIPEINPVVREHIEQKTQVTPPTTRTRKKDEKIKVGLLVPLTGSSASLGRAMSDAAELALFDIGNPNLIILPFDTKGTPKGAKNATYEALEHDVKLILGPLFSETTEAAAPVALKHGVNVISFSNNKKLSKRGVFLLGFMPEQQIRRVTKFALSQGIRDFSALVPKDTFGDVVLGELRNTLRSERLSPKHVESYRAMDAALSESIREITELDERDSTLKEGKYEALLLPEGGRNLLTITARIVRHNVDSERFRFLGSGQWDDPVVANESRLEGSWFASSPPRPRELFEKHFSKTFGYQPVRIASLSYDGVALAALLAGASGGPDFSKSAIRNERGFSGVNGAFRFTWDGLPERALAILEVRKGRFRVIDRAPQGFD